MTTETKTTKNRTTMWWHFPNEQSARAGSDRFWETGRRRPERTTIIEPSPYKSGAHLVRIEGFPPIIVEDYTDQWVAIGLEFGGAYEGHGPSWGTLSLAWQPVGNDDSVEASRAHNLALSPTETGGVDFVSAYAANPLDA